MAQSPTARKRTPTARPAKESPAVPARRAPNPAIEPDGLEANPLPSGLMVVGVGASAGGLEAFIELLQAAPSDAGFAYVFVQHLSPHHVSALPALLSPHTAMPVVTVINGVHIEPNQVYVIPPNVEMILTHDTLQLSPRRTESRSPTPIDGFLLSMAESACDRAIGIVLSGTGSDGAIGLRDVKACGGITFAQLPESAKFDGMPRAAIATGMIDFVLTPTQIGADLRQIGEHPFAGSGAAESQEFHGTDLARVFALLRAATKVDFSHYKQPTIRRRLLRRMALHRIDSLPLYIKQLQADPHEVQGLFQDLLIHVTQFFREPDSFQALREQVFPNLLAGRHAEQPIRAWVCGCATGEEAYSLAIELSEYLQREQSPVRAQIFGTDVSEDAIAHARSGVYPSTIKADVSADRLSRYFIRSDGHYRVSKQIRDLCVFARQDLIKDPPFSRVDIVMCRNVLIYMDAELQRRLMALFHYALVPNGYLVLGHAESVGQQASLFGVLDKKHRIHRKKTLQDAAPMAQHALAQYSGSGARKRPALEVPDRQPNMEAEVSRVMLERFAPPGVVVDADLQIVQFRGQTGPFLEPAPGDASLNVLKMVREGLLHGVRSAIEEARKSRRPATRNDLQVRNKQRWTGVAIEVVPLTVAPRPHFLVLFKGERAAADKPQRKAASARKQSRTPKSTVARLEAVQRELDASREYLQATIQELEAANEELQSANEEILSSNEELQSTNEELDTAKEELQSTNEELNTVNDELQGRNDELSRVNSDLMNLVGSVHIAIIIVGGDLRIRRFTAMAEKIFNVIPADLNRSIAQINPNIVCPDLAHLIVECVQTLTPVERDVRDLQGRWFALRIRPYRGVDNKIDGAVLSAFDIDVLKRSEQTTHRAQIFADALLEESSEPVALLESDFTINRVNRAFADLFEAQPEDLVGRKIDDAGGAAWNLAGWREDPHRLTGGLALPSIAIRRHAATLTVNARAVPAPDRPDTTLLMVSVTDGLSD